MDLGEKTEQIHMDQNIALSPIKRNESKKKKEINLLRNQGDEGTALTTRMLLGISSNPPFCKFSVLAE